MDIEVKRFEKEYQDEVYTIRALLIENVTGARIDGNYYIPSVRFCAYIDERTEKLYEGEGDLHWIIPRMDDDESFIISSPLFFYEFEEMKIYRLSVRRKIEEPYDDPEESLFYNNGFMITDLLEEDISDKRLDFIRKKLSKPIKMKSNIGEFIFDIQYNWFEGLLDWNGFEANVFLELDEEGNKAKKALSYLRKIYKKKNEMHTKFIEYIFQNFQHTTGRKSNYQLEDYMNEIYLTEIYVQSDVITKKRKRWNNDLDRNICAIRWRDRIYV